MGLADRQVPASRDPLAPVRDRVVDRWRMVVTFRDNALTIVRIEEVSAHYGN